MRNTKDLDRLRALRHPLGQAKSHFIRHLHHGQIQMPQFLRQAYDLAQVRSQLLLDFQIGSRSIVIAEIQSDKIGSDVCLQDDAGQFHYLCGSQL